MAVSFDSRNNKTFYLKFFMPRFFSQVVKYVEMLRALTISLYKTLNVRVKGVLRIIIAKTCSNDTNHVSQRLILGKLFVFFK